ncbi:helix-turn-helix transcriptional regulator [Mycolicibacterium chubuense]|uniref:Putative HTH-type transcriptional regulator n=1 Tax=Mycolicibacterium chubuense TaxID=1800 RepID=A0A0J6VS43_MYCCU|nr:LuxR family transcriptional regulator [Mycolicibacterium chubuense]KMO73860.1 putative HTH-type transcriptional regulator [Mycolicibacterium chubuense]ORA54964.1 helix-turn-helix transcriptional regulator [Mycolicibacterium chubuense]SPX97662.1 regulatory protein [Mycolicibacterium chubuense]
MSQSALAGRHDAMSVALAALRSSERTGRGSVVVVSGEPGIGKSAVVNAVAQEARRSGFRVGTGKAEQGDQIAPGAPLLVALRSGAQPLLTDDAFAGLASLYDKPLWLVDRISILLGELSAQAPTLIAIDDVQWADRLTMFALRVLPSRLADSPVVWVFASRLLPGDPLTEIVGGVHDPAMIARIPLGPLPFGDIEQLAVDRLDAPLTEHTRSLLAGVGGNPFFAVQVIDGLARRHERGESPSDLHTELAYGVHARLAGLSESAVALTRLTAVWARSLAVADAAELLGGISHAHVWSLARESAANGLLRTFDDTVSSPHDLIRDAVYADIPADERRNLHRHCARHILGRGGSPLAAAAHLRASAEHDDEETVVALLDAARECQGSMPDQAAEFAHQALHLTTPFTSLWLRTGERAVETLVGVQREGEALTVARRLLAAAQDPETMARIEVHVCRALWHAGDYVGMAQHARRAAGREGLSDALRARLRAAEALAASRNQPAASAEAMARNALAEARRHSDEHAQRMASVALIETARNEGRHFVALRRFADLRTLSDSSYLAEEIRTLQHLDRYDDAQLLLDRIGRARDRDDDQLPSILYAQMWQDNDLGRLDAAEAGAIRLLRLADETGNNGFWLNATTVLAAVAARRGDLGRAADLLAPADDRLRADAQSLRLQVVGGMLKAITGDVGAGMAILAPLIDDEGDARDPWQWTAPWMRFLARMGLNAGDRRFAGRAARVAELAAERNPGIATFEGTALHIRGLLNDDEEVLAEAVTALRGSPRPLLLADALTDLGAALLAGRRRDDGMTALTEAGAIYREAGATAGSSAVAAHLPRESLVDGNSGVRPGRPSSGWAALTPTELRVVDLITRGHTNRSAATELGVSTHTVNTHLRAVFRKLDVRSRVQLTIVAGERRADGIDADIAG